GPQPGGPRVPRHDGPRSSRVQANTGKAEAGLLFDGKSDYKQNDWDRCVCKAERRAGEFGWERDKSVFVGGLRVDELDGVSLAVRWSLGAAGMVDGCSGGGGGDDGWMDGMLMER